MHQPGDQPSVVAHAEKRRKKEQRKCDRGKDETHDQQRNLASVLFLRFAPLVEGGEVRLRFVRPRVHEETLAQVGILRQLAHRILATLGVRRRGRRREPSRDFGLRQRGAHRIQDREQRSFAEEVQVMGVGRELLRFHRFASSGQLVEAVAHPRQPERREEDARFLALFAERDLGVPNHQHDERRQRDRRSDRAFSCTEPEHRTARSDGEQERSDAREGHRERETLRGGERGLLGHEASLVMRERRARGVHREGPNLSTAGVAVGHRSR